MMKTLIFLCLTALAATPARSQTPRPKLNHIALQVTDLAKSTRFYRDIIRLDTIPNPFNDGRHTWLALGNGGHLHLIVAADSSKPVIPLKNSHLCLSLPSTKEFANRLKLAGIPFEDWPGKPNAITLRPDGIHQLYLQDPDGYWIEVNDDYPGK